MASYITRVELHGAVGPDYDKLHAEMQRLGFSRDITSKDQKTYHLPTAMYRFETGQANTPALAIRDLAMTAAQATGKNYWVLTTRYDEVAWFLNTTQPT